MQQSILIIEDDPDIAESVRYNLQREGLVVNIAQSGEQGFKMATDPVRTPSLIVLDLMLPGMNGSEVCERLRRKPETEKIPIIILTAKASEADKITGLDLGADDYMTKPFSVKELTARIRAVLRRANEDASPSYKDEKLTIDFDDVRVTCCGNEVKLTRKEFALLTALVKSQNRVATRQKLLDIVWGYDYYGDTRTLDVHVRRLRQKLGVECAVSIETVVGVGYRFTGSY
ncbi:MAG: response regulator transcription factor [Pyrinomonadaceae bacterium]